VEISVIIPTFNRAPVLARALDSVLSQSAPPAEILVVDDGSADDTPGLLTGRFPQVRYLRQAHGGVSRARNAGIAAARGEWLAFLDSDDEWLTHKLAAQRRALRAHPQYRVCHSDEIWIRQWRRVNPMRKHAKRGGWIFRHCLARCVISPSSVLLHRSVLERVGPFDDSLPACEDYDLWLRLCASYPVLYCDEPLIVKYGGHADQLSRRHWGMDRFRVQALERVLTTGTLDPGDRSAALDMLLEKSGIVLQGARKRGNEALVREYEARLGRYRAWRDAAPRTNRRIQAGSLG
jgi:glycosyltransferase involved in cell wall biosynthesis